MKKIYAFTIDDDEIPSNVIKNNLQLVAFFLYDLVSSYEMSESREVLVKNKSIKYNDIIQVKEDGINSYSFESNFINFDYRLFEPFIILDEKTFGLTVYDGSISDDEMQELANISFLNAHVKNKYRMTVGYYTDKVSSDGNKRLKAIDKIRESIHDTCDSQSKKFSFAKLLIPTKSLIKG